MPVPGMLDRSRPRPWPPHPGTDRRQEHTRMALPHAQPMDIISVAPLGGALPSAVSTSLIKTGRMQLLHLVLRAHQDQPEHHVEDECTVHCLEGVVEVVTPG